MKEKHEYSLFLALSVQIFRQITIFVVFILRLLVRTVHEVECALPCGVFHSVGDLLQLVAVVGIGKLVNKPVGITVLQSVATESEHVAHKH